MTTTATFASSSHRYESQEVISLTEGEEHDEDPGEDFQIDHTDRCSFLPPRPTELGVERLDILQTRYVSAQCSCGNQ